MVVLQQTCFIFFLRFWWFFKPGGQQACFWPLDLEKNMANF
jgi:hypothetical protein